MENIRDFWVAINSIRIDKTKIKRIKLPKRDVNHKPYHTAFIAGNNKKINAEGD